MARTVATPQAEIALVATESAVVHVARQIDALDAERSSASGLIHQKATLTATIAAMLTGPAAVAATPTVVVITFQIDALGEEARATQNLEDAALGLGNADFRSVHGTEQTGSGGPQEFAEISPRVNSRHPSSKVVDRFRIHV